MKIYTKGLKFQNFLVVLWEYLPIIFRLTTSEVLHSFKDIIFSLLVATDIFQNVIMVLRVFLDEKHTNSNFDSKLADPYLFKCVPLLLLVDCRFGTSGIISRI